MQFYESGMIILQKQGWNISTVIGTLTISALNVPLGITKSSKEAWDLIGMTTTNGVISFKFTHFSGLNPAAESFTLGGASARQCQRVAFGAKCNRQPFHLGSKITSQQKPPDKVSVSQSLADV